MRQQRYVGGVDAVLVQSLADAVDHGLAEILRRGQQLGDRDAAGGFLHQGDVGEGAADIDADTPSHTVGSLCAMQHALLRTWGGIQTAGAALPTRSRRLVLGAEEPMPAPAPIDCDLHPSMPGLPALMPYLDDMWRETIVRRGVDELNTIAYPSNSPLTARADWRDERGKPASTAERLGKEALDPFGTSIAICNCLYGVQATFSEDFGAAMARAVNDWIVREWLDRDPRLRASIVVPQQNAELAVAEIERCAPDRRFVQVMLLVSGELPLGRRQNWPIYAAAERHGLPIGIHAGSTYRHPNTPVGWSSYLSEEYINQAGAFQTQLTSLVTEGVFAKFPDLTVVLMESGVTWLPGYLWRLTKFWRGLRHEVPWVADPPATIVRERVRLTLQPFDGPPDPATITRFMEHMQSDELLLFSTDYPHWQFEGTAAIPEGLDPALAQKIMVDNPLRTYARLRETIS